MAKWTPVELAPGDRQVARGARAAGQEHGVELAPQRRRGPTSTPDVRARSRSATPSASIWCEAPVEHALLHLELGDAVAEQPADAVGALEDRDRVAGAGELLGGREARRARSRRPPPSCRCAPAGGSGATQPSSKAWSMMASSISLIVTGSSLMPSTQEPSHGRGAERAGELREVVGGVQAVDGLAPLVAVDEVVPVGDEVAERAALVAEGDAAVHAARALLAQLVLRPRAASTCRQSRMRSSTGRYGCLSRLNSMKPVTLPMASPSCGRWPSRPRPPTCRSPAPS